MWSSALLVSPASRKVKVGVSLMVTPPIGHQSLLVTHSMSHDGGKGDQNTI